MTIDEAIKEHKKYEKLANERKKGVRNQEVVKIQMGLASYHSQMAEWLEELKIFQELYPNTNIKSSLQNNYENGWNDAIERVSDVASWNQKGLGGYYSITSEDLESIRK